MVLPLLLLGVASFIISWLLTALMIRLAPKLGLVDTPGGRKIHENPRPLGGGIGIVLGFALPLICSLVLIWFGPQPAEINFISYNNEQELKERTDLARASREQVALASGAREQTPLAVAFVAATLLMHLLGLIDDKKHLGPLVKFAVQLALTTALVTGFKEVRVLTALGNVNSIVLTTLWIVAITNAFNFLDNMDGLSAGVGVVASTAFLIAAITLPQPQWFVAATLALLIGSLLGFLCWNFPPARIFMGDSGSLVIGFVLGVLTVRTTFLQPGKDLGAAWYSLLAPVIVLALPLYDLVVVSIIRLSRGKSPFVGDTNHFSHRLVARGMSRRTAVLCLYLITAATSIAAILLPHVQTTFAAILILCQTVLILGVVATLEQHPLPLARNDQ